MKDKIKKVSALSSSAVLLASMGAAGVASTSSKAEAEEVSVLECNMGDDIQLVSLPSVVGDFSFTQCETSSISAIAKNLATASQYLCSSESNAQSECVDPVAWRIAVTGDIKNKFEASLEELSDDGAAQLIMGCSCAGNPAGGLASANAEVLGVTLSSIIKKAEIDSSVNTVVFTSSDGYCIELPYFYVVQHFSLIVYDLNGEPLANSMGGSNQLWLGATAASYFSQDIQEIRFEARETLPPSPGSKESGDAYPNLPNTSFCLESDAK